MYLPLSKPQSLNDSCTLQMAHSTIHMAMLVVPRHGAHLKVNPVLPLELVLQALHVEFCLV